MSFGKLGAMGRGFGHLGALGRAGTSTPPTANTLVAGKGTFILTGDAMTPLVDYKIPSDVAAFTLTGQAAALSSTATGGTARQFMGLAIYRNAEATARSFAAYDHYVTA